MYCGFDWGAYQQSDIDKLENIQRRAAHLIFHNYKYRTPGCVTDMLKDRYYYYISQYHCKKEGNNV